MKLSQWSSSLIFIAQKEINVPPQPPSNSSGSCCDLRAHQACTAPAALRNEVGAFAQAGDGFHQSPNKHRPCETWKNGRLPSAWNILQWVILLSPSGYFTGAGHSFKGSQSTFDPQPTASLLTSMDVSPPLQHMLQWSTMQVSTSTCLKIGYPKSIG